MRLTKSGTVTKTRQILCSLTENKVVHSLMMKAMTQGDTKKNMGGHVGENATETRKYVDKMMLEIKKTLLVSMWITLTCQ